MPGRGMVAGWMVMLMLMGMGMGMEMGMGMGIWVLHHLLHRMMGMGMGWVLHHLLHRMDGGRQREWLSEAAGIMAA